MITCITQAMPVWTGYFLTTQWFAGYLTTLV